MQGKGLIKLVLILLILVSAMQFLFMIPTNKVEKNAKEYAEQIAAKSPEAERHNVFKAKRIAYLDSMSSENIFSIPLLKDYTYDELKGQQLAFGLDLKGGMSAVLQVKLKDLLIALSNNSKNRDFRDALNNAVKAQESNQSDYVTLFYQEWRKISGDGKLAKIFNNAPAIGEDINVTTSDGEVVRLLKTKADETVQLTFDRLKQRIDRLGVSQPTVSLDEARDLILVEVPGVDNPERVKKFLQASAVLEFWDVYQFRESNLVGLMTEADRRLAAKGDSTLLEKRIVIDTIAEPIPDSLGHVIDTVYRYEEREVDQLGGQGPLLSKLQVNGLGGQQLYQNPVIGIAEKRDTSAIGKYLRREEIKRLFPNDLFFVWSRKPIDNTEADDDSDYYQLFTLKKQSGSDKPPLEGDVVISASQSPDPNTGQPSVSLSMNKKGAKKWAEMTTIAAQNSNREVAITLDNEVVTSPTVNEPITQGRSSINGGFTVQEAVDLANILEIGKLPAKTEIIQQATVGPSLGKKNILSARNSLLVGMSLLLLFMLFYYGGAGIVSIIALLLNVLFIFGALASFGTVLTLPGFAGIVLTIGMAVDANVIIFERVKEELRAGKTLLASITDGFRNSYSAIIDANVTTILVAMVLSYFGLGPIKGFAVVLMIGVIMSIFTAVLVGRLIIDWWTAGRGNNLTFWNPWSKSMFANLNIDWIGKRKIAYVISGILLTISLASIFTRGFDLGVEFRGGYQYNVQFDEGVDIDAETLRTGLETTLGYSPVVKAVDTEGTYNVLTRFPDSSEGDDLDEVMLDKLYEGLSTMAEGGITMDNFKDADAQNGTHITSSNKVGPTIADDIKRSSYKAGILALVLIFLYIFLRFNKWQYSLGAVAALFHDAIIVLGLFSLLWGRVPFALELDQAFIAAILTVIGYSINDTVVVFDRIREDFGIYANKSKDEVINQAVNSTFSRTIITSFTTLLVVTILFIFGGGSIKGFAFALLIGIIVGTYSSVFVATPLVRDLSDKLRSTKTKTSDKKSFSRAAKKK